jgi:5-methylcytosine-specific restriction endonuclease McrA
VENASVLLVNVDGSVMGVRPVSRAIRLLMKGKAKAPYGFDDFHDVKTPDGVMMVPTALEMVYYVRIPYRNVPCTKVNILRRDGYECQYCGKKLTNVTGTVDHVMPQSRGGRHHWSNVVASCKGCNGKKDNKTPAECGMKLRCTPYIPKHDMLMIHAVGKRGSWKRWMIT